MGARLGQLADELGDLSGLAEVAARGHALKGSAALAELPYLSRAGAILQRAAELAAEDAARNHAPAKALVRATRAALGAAQRLLEDSVNGTPESQERLLEEMTGVFHPEARAALLGIVRRDEASEAASPEFEEFTRLAAVPADELDAEEALE